MGQRAATILVVDDEPDVVLVVRVALELDGHTVLEAADGAAAFELARGRDVDVVVTDLRMPEGGGRELIRRLRADPRTHQIPILLLTATAGEDLGADAVIGKPFRTVSLLEAIGRLLASAAQGMAREAPRSPRAI